MTFLRFFWNWIGESTREELAPAAQGWAEVSWLAPRRQKRAGLLAETKPVLANETLF